MAPSPSRPDRTLRLLLLITTLALAARPAVAFTLRSPQVAFDSAVLQAHLDAWDGGIQANTDQVDGQVLSTALLGRIFVLELLKQSGAEFGVYAPSSAGEPAHHAIFANSSTAGSFATVRFTPDDKLVVTRFDSLAIYVGSTVYAWPGGSDFGFYAAAPGGAWYSQDARNVGRAHALTFAGTGANTSGLFECFEPRPYSPGDPGAFAGLVVFVDRTTCGPGGRPGLGATGADCTPARPSTWGSLKAHYR